MANRYERRHRLWNQKIYEQDRDFVRFKEDIQKLVKVQSSSLPAFQLLENLRGFSIDDSDSSNKNTILQMSFGKMPIGRCIYNGRPIISLGAKIVYSPIPIGGGITVTLYPAKGVYIGENGQDEILYSGDEDCIILRIGKYNNTQLCSHLRKDLTDLVDYQHVSDLSLHATLRQRLKIWRYKIIYATNKQGQYSGSVLKKSTQPILLNGLILFGKLLIKITSYFLLVYVAALCATYGAPEWVTSLFNFIKDTKIK